MVPLVLFCMLNGDKNVHGVTRLVSSQGGEGGKVSFQGENMLRHIKTVEVFVLKSFLGCFR